MESGDWNDLIETGDILAWEAVNAFGNAVCRFSDHWCCHVGLAVRMQIGGRESGVWTFDMLRSAGGVATPLTAWVGEHPGKCHVFRVKEGLGYKPFDAAIYYRDRFLGQEYGTAGVLRAAASTRWWSRWLGVLRPNRDDAHVSEEPPFCSHAVAATAQFGGGLDLVPGLASESTWPRDVVGSSKLKEVFHALTLVAL